VGAVYQSTADGKFYTPLSASTQTEVFRGIRRDYPKSGVAWVAESGRVVGYDIGTVGAPMWMVFTCITANSQYLLAASGYSSLACMNGMLLVGNSVVNALTQISLLEDNCRYINISSTRTFGGPISTRNASPWATNRTTSTSVVIVNNTVNSVAITTLDNAPIDPATGLPVPTIAVATAGGVSVIKDNGTVVNITGADGNNACTQVGFIGTTLLFHAGSFQRTCFGNIPTASTNLASIITGYSRAYCWVGTTPRVNGPVGYPFLSVGANFYSTYGLSLVKENPTAPTKGMVAYITTIYNSGWLCGDVKGAYLADTVAETIVGSGELVTNGTFATDTSGWTPSAATLAIVSGELQLTTTAASGTAAADIAVTTVVGKTYRLQATMRQGTCTSAVLLGINGIATGVNVAGTTNTTVAFDWLATTTSINVRFYTTSGGIGQTAYADNISVKLAEPDRSVKNNGLVINGTLTKTAVASGAGLVAYSGFSAANYLEQPYNSDLDFGTGDFCVMGWVNLSATGSQYFFDRGTVGGGRITLAVATTYYYSCSNTGGVQNSSITATTGLHHLCLSRVSGVLSLFVDGVSVFSIANALNVTNAAGVARVGLDLGGTVFTSGSLALWRVSATAPSADQIAHIYRTELPLFQVNAKCTIDGTSTAVTALAYDDVTDLLQVGTSWGRTSFKDLLRVDSEATTTGALTSLAASGGTVLTGGTSAKVYQPALRLRDELQRREEARKALGRMVVAQEFTATSNQTVFVATRGYDVRFVYANGLLKRLTTDYTVSDDGFQNTVTLLSGVTTNTPVTLMLTRS